MLKFKVGDVLVAKENKRYTYKEEQLEIEVLEVDEMSDVNTYRTTDEPDYWWCKHTVEDNYELKPMKYMSLKNGDKIRITQRGSHEFHAGEVVVVNFTRENSGQHVFADHQHKGAVCGYLHEDEYELIEEPKKSEDEKVLELMKHAKEVVEEYKIIEEEAKEAEKRYHELSERKTSLQNQLLELRSEWLKIVFESEDK